MKDKVKIKMADEILRIIDELQEEDDPIMEEEDIFEDKKGKPIIKIKVKGK